MQEASLSFLEVHSVKQSISDMKIAWIVNPDIEATLLLAAVAVLAPLLMGLSSRPRHSTNSSHPALLLYFLLGVSAVYIALMPYVLSFLTSYLSSLKNEHDWTYFVLIMFSIVLIQFLRAKADVAALAVAAITSPVADDDIDGLKIRPSMVSLAYPFWVAALVIYSIYTSLRENGHQPRLRHRAVRHCNCAPLVP